MSAGSRVRSWWKALRDRHRAESDVESELRFHIESYAADLVRSGVEREEALRRAKAELGSVAAQKDEWRASIGLRVWDDLRADVRYAFRQLRSAPAFTATVLLVLALGIGANAAMFSVIDATLLRWLPYSRPSEILSLTAVDAKGTPSFAAYADFEEWQRQSHTLSSVACYMPNSAYVKAAGDDQMVSAPAVSSDFFTVLGTTPAMGRGFIADEQLPGKGKVVVLSDRAWQTMLRADPDIVGKKVTINDIPYTVVGVMPPRFAFPIEDPTTQIWLPLETTPNYHQRNFNTPPCESIGRMQKGATLAAVRAELSAIQQRLAPLYGKEAASDLAPSRVEVTRYRDTLVKNARPALRALLLAVGIIWLIACANVANLMLARSMSRQREIAVRGALGASRWRLLRQLITESLMLSFAGSLAGLALAQLSLKIFEKALSSQLHLPEHLAPSATVLAALLVLSVLSAVVSGLLPAWLAARTPLEHSMRQGQQQSGGSRRRHQLQQAMVVAEIGLSLVLLIACGLLLRTVFALRRVPLGFRTDHVLMIQPKVPRYKYRGMDLNRAVYQPLLERVKQMNGVRSASLTTVVPLSKGFDSMITFYVGHGDKAAAPTRIDAKLRAAGPELQDVLAFRMYQGRFFNQQDTADSQPVAVVNRAFARLYAPGGDVVEKTSIRLGRQREAKIVGVMDDFHQAAIDEPSVPEIDFCAPQLKETDGFYQPTMQVHVELAVRTEKDPAKFIPDLRSVMTSVSPDLKGSVFATMDQVVEDAMGSQLLAAHLLEIFAGSALLVALAGLYGLLSYLVVQRRQELGVRLALGAPRGSIIQLVLKQAGWMLLGGAAIGALLAYFSSRTLAGFLYGVKPSDLWTMLVVSTVLLVSGMIAAYLPARRAAHVDPLEALREE
jgi:predicted permease